MPRRSKFHPCLRVPVDHQACKTGYQNELDAKSQTETTWWSESGRIIWCSALKQERDVVIGAGNNYGPRDSPRICAPRPRVAVADIDKAGADETAGLIAGGGGEAVGVHCDVTSEQSVAAQSMRPSAFSDRSTSHMNNAGILHSGNPRTFPLPNGSGCSTSTSSARCGPTAIVMPKWSLAAKLYRQHASFAAFTPSDQPNSLCRVQAALISMSENLRSI